MIVISSISLNKYDKTIDMKLFFRSLLILDDFSLVFIPAKLSKSDNFHGLKNQLTHRNDRTTKCDEIRNVGRGAIWELDKICQLKILNEIREKTFLFHSSQYASSFNEDRNVFVLTSQTF